MRGSTPELLFPPPWDATAREVRERTRGAPPSGRRGWASGTGGWEEALGPQAIPGPLGIKKLVSDGFPYLKNTGNGDYWVNIRILILKKRNSFQRHAGPRPTDSVDSNNKICPPRSAGAEERRPGHRGELRGPGPMLELS